VKNNISVNRLQPLNINFDVESYIEKIMKLKLIKNATIEFNFVDNKYIKNINKKYLNKEYATDIISFNLEEKNKDILGDIYISIEQAKTNASNFNNSFENEIKLLIIHGILHLLGYRDYTENEKLEMNKEQTMLLLQSENQ
jgi:probable rRNA maturation factor